jgi:hypothetical protein
MVDNAPVTHEYTPNAKGGGFVMRIAKEGQPTVDGRIFDKDSISWREPPIPFMFIRSNDPSGRGGHKSSVAVAAITDIWKEKDEEGFATVYGRGYFSMDEEGQNARNLIKEGVISGVSADVGGAVVEELAEEGDPDIDGGLRITRRIKSGEIVAVTGLPIPAFDDMKVSVTAAAVPDGWAPPKAWFSNPGFVEPTALTVTADGRVMGHVAVWGTCHVGHRDRCVTPPRSKSNYQYFNVGQVLTAEGEAVSVGRLTAGTGHAALEFGANPAAAHYDHTGWAAAFVHSGEDEHGIWVSGAVSPNATPEQVATLRAAAVSGDWRSVNGALEMVAVLAVNSPGFPVPRPKAGLIAGAQISLVAANIVADCGCGCKGKGDCSDNPDHKVEEDEFELRIGFDEETTEELSETPEETVTEEAEEGVEEVVESPEEEEDFEAVLAQWDVEILFPATA